jgi:hypothetical protein
VLAAVQSRSRQTCTFFVFVIIYGMSKVNVVTFGFRCIQLQQGWQAALRAASAACVSQQAKL